jgi:hypothetical protein
MQRSNEPVPPQPDGLVADIETSLMQQVLDIAERKWKPDVHHDRQVDNFGAAVKIFEGACFRHNQRQRNGSARINPICPDKTTTSLEPSSVLAQNIR